MLILTRKPREAVLIGPSIKITVLGIKGNQVRIGFDAPRDMVVDREEVADRKILESQASMRAQASPDPRAPGTLHIPAGRNRRQSNTVDEKR